MANQVFNLIQQQKRAQRQRPIALVRNLLIVLGLLGMLGQIVLAFSSRNSGAEGEDASAKSGAPVLLNTANPPTAPVLQLSKPTSIEQAFGRSLLTGVQVEDVPRDPLASLAIDRRWDAGMPPAVYKAPADLPAQPASDEVREPPRPAKAGEIRDDEYEDLPVEARKRVVVAQKLYKKARELMEAVVPNHPDWSAKQREAAELLKNARDELYQALAEAPGSRALLDLMQQVKADLYACNKHRLK